VLEHLERVAREHPDTDLFVLSEYSFDGPVPGCVREWCRRHQRYLLAGGKAPQSGDTFRNTAFVVGPDGEVIFEQAKSVPIQFFKDGLPALAQRVWDSPWGRLGICICYDLSYTRVVDRLVRLGAEALVVPTMDVADWGKNQHALHALVAPARAAEYRLPIFRLASSGISQVVTTAGRVVATAPHPGSGQMIAGRLFLRGRGRLPWDRVVAPVCVAGCAGFSLWRLGRAPWVRKSKSTSP
jgi:predicted amidohydrolase